MKHWIAIDWGTTNFRAYLLNGNNQLIDKNFSHSGLLSVQDNQFASVLRENIQLWKDSLCLSEVPMYMSGMVGSKQGWKEVSYLSVPILLEDVAKDLCLLELPWETKGFIVSGVSCQNQFDIYDVMRGEETQLLGLKNIVKQSDFIAILPGTHSKHCHIESGLLTQFSTVMTGELFSLLDRYSLLTKQTEEVYSDRLAFLSGVERGYSHPLASILFSARTLLLKGEIASSQVRSYLSGLLIGNEISQVTHSNKSVYIVGSKHVSQKYFESCSYLGINAEIIDGEQCFLEGMKFIRYVNKDNE